MTETTLVRGTMHVFDMLLLATIGLGIVIVGGACFAFEHFLLGNGLLAVGTFISIVSGSVLRRRIASRQWLLMAADSFTLIDNSGEVTIPDSHVQRLAIRMYGRTAEGEFCEYTRTLSIWIGESSSSQLQRIDLTTTYRAADVDPLESLIRRLHQQLLEKFRENLAAGAEISGDGWRLSRSEFVIQDNSETLRCHPNEIAMSAVVDDSLCIWRKDVDEPWAKIDLASANVYVLKELLVDASTKDSSHVEPAPSSNRLGRIIFERRYERFTTAFLTIAAVAAPVSSAGFFVYGYTNQALQQREQIYFAGIALLGLTIAFALGAMYCHWFLFRCYEFGITCRGLLGTKALRYEHTVEFCYHAIHQINTKGMYTGTRFILDFEPDVEHKSNHIRYDVTLQHADAAIDQLRDRVSEIMGKGMVLKISSGMSVGWTPGLYFQGANLICDPRSVRSAEAITIPLNEIRAYFFRDGNCFLIKRNAVEPFIGIDTRDTNFFPGFRCMQELTRTQSGESLVELQATNPNRKELHL